MIGISFRQRIRRFSICVLLSLGVVGCVMLGATAAIDRDRRDAPTAPWVEVPLGAGRGPLFAAGGAQGTVCVSCITSRDIVAVRGFSERPTLTRVPLPVEGTPGCLVRGGDDLFMSVLGQSVLLRVSEGDIAEHRLLSTSLVQPSYLTCVGEDRVFVTDDRKHQIATYDVKRARVIEAVPLPGRPLCVFADSTGDTVWVGLEIEKSDPDGVPRSLVQVFRTRPLRHVHDVWVRGAPVRQVMPEPVPGQAIALSEHPAVLSRIALTADGVDTHELRLDQGFAHDGCLIREGRMAVWTGYGPTGKDRTPWRYFLRAAPTSTPLDGATLAFPAEFGTRAKRALGAVVWVPAQQRVVLPVFSRDSVVIVDVQEWLGK